MDCIYGKEIASALDDSYRVYLCGDLQKPQSFKWIHDENNEVGISFYKMYTVDQPHFHTKATEYNYIICGSTKLLLIDSQKEYLFEAGSIFVLPPMTKYATKHLAGTKVLFFKSPGGNDKNLVEMDSTLKNWLHSW